jgi:hypothetical protein
LEGSDLQYSTICWIFLPYSGMSNFVRFVLYSIVFIDKILNKPKKTYFIEN